MSEIFFYHLTETPIEQVLPSLAERSLARGWRVMILCPNEEECKKLDAWLWNFTDASFLPHGTEADAFPQEQPILLSLNEANQNGAQVCFCAGGVCAENPQNFSRLCLIFDGHNAEQLQMARAAWKKWQAEEDNGEKRYALSYWQQTPQRKWIKKETG